MSDDKDTELLETLDRLGPESDGERADLETLGLLPYGLDDLPARPEIKHRLMASVTGSAAAARAERWPTDRRRLSTLERRSRWFLPIAASLAAALLGIAAVQFRQLERQERTIEQLSSQLERVERNGTAMAEIRRLLAEKGRHVKMMTTRGTEFCLLKPAGERPRYPGATATMVIAPDRREWFLAAEGLEPCPAEVCYQLWFITEGEPIHAASFAARNDQPRIELSGSQDGALEGVRAISITRDAAPEDADPPETVLYADQAMTLL